MNNNLDQFDVFNNYVRDGGGDKPYWLLFTILDSFPIPTYHPWRVPNPNFSYRDYKNIIYVSVCPEGRVR